MSVVMHPSVGAPARAAGNLLDEVLELIVDRGLVIDVFVRVSLVGIELRTIDARVDVASADTYLRFAEACNRIDLHAPGNPVGLAELTDEVVEETADAKSNGGLDGVSSTVADTIDDLVGSNSGRST